MVKPQMQGNQMGVWGVVLALVDMQQSTTQADRYATINHTRWCHLRTRVMADSSTITLSLFAPLPWLLCIVAHIANKIK